jgi:hypothetical protein
MWLQVALAVDCETKQHGTDAGLRTLSFGAHPLLDIVRG